MDHWNEHRTIPHTSEEGATITYFQQGVYMRPKESRWSVPLYDCLYHTVSRLNDTGSYPPYNMYSKGNRAVIEIAVTGFSKKDLKVTRVDNELTITGNRGENPYTEDVVFQYRGLARRDFKRSFILQPTAIVESVIVQDGILTITLHKDAPPEKRPIEFDIE
jgi:molecular chaperone IbpA